MIMVEINQIEIKIQDSKEEDSIVTQIIKVGEIKLANTYHKTIIKMVVLEVEGEEVEVMEVVGVVEVLLILKGQH